MDFIIKPEIRGYLRTQTKEENEALRAKIKEEGCLPGSLTVAKLASENVLIDGHHTYDICLDEKIPHGKPRIIPMKDLDEVRTWMRKTQLARRNLTDEERTFLVGLEYKERKKTEGNPAFSQHGQNVPVGGTAETIAEEQGVSRKTVQRAEQFTEAVEKLEPAQKETVLNGTSGLSKKAITEGAVPVLCKDCQRKGARLNCEKCAEARKDAKKPPKPKAEEQSDADESAPDDAILDDDGNPVPAKLRTIFAEVYLFRSASAMLAKTAIALEKVEKSRAYQYEDRQAANEKGDRRVYSTVCRTAEKKMIALRPAKICCVEGCKKCGQKGFFTADEIES